MIHSFAESLALSKEHEDAPWWPKVYAKAFPGFSAMMSVRDDGWAQRGGIDRVIMLRSGRVVTVDEKVRSCSYGDVLLERWSNRERKTPGWIQKDLACDFIAYAFIPDERCYLFPFLPLRAAWLENGRDWIAKAEAGLDGFRVILAQNDRYATESVAVPIPEILAAIHRAQVVDWGAA